MRLRFRDNHLNHALLVELATIAKVKENLQQYEQRSRYESL
jgi:hypothetical protein